MKSHFDGLRIDPFLEAVLRAAYIAEPLDDSLSGEAGSGVALVHGPEMGEGE